jgi:protoporphyrinogen oxidase
MKDYIQARNGLIYESTPVLEIKVGPNPEIIFQKGSQVFDKVIWTGPVQALPLLIKGTETKVERNANTFQYMNVTCLVLVMKRKQGDIYWLNNIDPTISFGVAIEHTNLVSSEDYGGQHVLYVANYHSGKSILNQLSDKEVLDFHLFSLQKVFPDFKEKDIHQARVFRDTHSCPVYDLCYCKKMPRYEGWYPKLDICGMTQVYPEDRNMNNCVRNANNYLNNC